ncbi:3677_t:CDS:1 [Acaulospora morrowiae]|uniref:3677_t:CDS:1 n=1 Tax=Acaulospora morrowiae TaxID=94023 RepID=A0A9N9NPS2_9GLOM|nr:3677_t:CDS:1 [Acaulospora morrowiae]
MLRFSNYMSSLLNKNVFGSGFINTRDLLIGKLVTQEFPATLIFDNTLYNENKNNRESNTKDRMSFGIEAKSLLQKKEDIIN